MPRFSEDEVLNFMVLEALVARGENDREKAEKAAKAKAHRQSHKGWDPSKGVSGG